EAAEETKSPVIMSTNGQVYQAHSIPYLGASGQSIIQMSSVPIFNHLDHSFSVEDCKLAIDNGYSSVMIDKSHLSLEDNIAAVDQVVKYAGSKGVGVEGEVGRIKGKSVEGTYTGNDYLAEVESVRKMCEETDVDYLAAGLG